MAESRFRRDKCQPCRAYGAVPKRMVSVTAPVYYVYILFSPSLNRHYVGFSRYRGVRRRQHIREKKAWTRRAADWQEAFCTTRPSRPEARELEKRIKARGARRFMEDRVDRIVPSGDSTTFLMRE